ncbi:RagB/SusD family nutrient uptake outer membrane protein [Bacteroides sp.]
MKKIITFLLFFLCLGVGAWSQMPYGVNYQAVIRDVRLQIVAEKNVSVRFSILKGGIGGQVVYTETHTAPTNKYGVLNLIMGHGITEDDFASIQWYDDSYFVKVEVDTEGGTNYMEISTQQMMSVPYALYAAKSGEVVGQKADFRLIGDEKPNPLNGETMSTSDSWGWMQVLFLNEQLQNIDVKLEGLPTGMSYNVEFGGKSVYGTSFNIHISCQNVQAKEYPLLLKVSNDAGVTKEYAFKYKVEGLQNPGSESVFDSQDGTRNFLSAIYSCRQQWLLEYFILMNESYTRKSNDLPEFSNYTFTASNPVIEKIWEKAYGYIEMANALIGYSMPTAEWASIAKGEAYALRAEAYLKLVETFGDVPLYLTADSKKQKLPRENRVEVLNVVVQDLSRAMEFLSLEPAKWWDCLIRRDAAFLRSQAYLLLGNWDNALGGLEGAPLIFPYRESDALLSKVIALYKMGRVEDAKAVIAAAGQYIDEISTDADVVNFSLRSLDGLGNGRFVLQAMGCTSSFLNIAEFRALLPIPASAIAENQNLTQNPGY